MAYDNNDNNERKNESVFSKRIRAGKRRTYFFDVKETRGSDYFLTITESRKRFDDNGYDRHKIFIYKEDFNKFIKALGESIDYVKTDLMPDFDFDAFNHEYPEGEGGEYLPANNTTNNSTNAESIVSEPEVATEPAPIVAEETVAEQPIEETPNNNNLSAEEVDKW